MSKSDILGKVTGKLTGLSGQKLAVIYDLLEKLCSKEGAAWFSRLKRFLREDIPFFLVLDTWMRLAINIKVSSNKDFEEAIKGKMIKIGAGASKMLKKVKYTKEVRSLELVMVGRGDLGRFTNIQDWFEYAREYGIQLCPQELIPSALLREYEKSFNLAISSQSFLRDFNLSPLVIMTEPISPPNDLPSFFVIQKEYGESLELTRVYCHKEIPPFCRWVFVKGK